MLSSCEKSTVLVVPKEDSNLVLKNGKLFYQENTFSGIVLDSNRFSQMKKRTSYINGRKHGKEVKKYFNDSLAELRMYNRGVKVGIHKGWWPNGNKKFEFYFNEKGFYHGSLKEWYVNGKLLKSFNYKDGKEQGSQKIWKQNGKIATNYVADDGERYGLIGLKKCYTVTENKNTLKLLK